MDILKLEQKTMFQQAKCWLSEREREPTMCEWISIWFFQEVIDLIKNEYVVCTTY